jgi:hypothetical protein
MGKTTVRKAAEVEWLRWLIEKIGRLGKPPESKWVLVPGSNPPRMRESLRTPWPFRTDKALSGFRDDLGRFAVAFVPSAETHDKYKPSYSTTRWLLERLWQIHHWARDAKPATAAIGRAYLNLEKTKAGRPRVSVDYDDGFEILLAFAELSGRYAGRFRICVTCEREFLAFRLTQNMCKRCKTRERVHRHRAGLRRKHRH